MPKEAAGHRSITHFVVMPDLPEPSPSRRWRTFALLGALAVAGASAGAGAVAVTGSEATRSQAAAFDEDPALTLALRRTPQEPETGQYHVLRSVETRLVRLRARQDELMTRQSELNALIEAAEKRRIVIDADAILPKRAPQPLVLARIENRPVAGPKPIPTGGQSVAVIDADMPPALRRAEELDLALRTLERAQDVVLDAIERAVEERSETLAQVPAELGLKMPVESTGGPLVELRGVDAPLAPADRFAVFRAAIEQVDELTDMVDALPVRSPLTSIGRVSSTYGKRVDPFLGRPAMHTGIDLAAPRGKPVLATARGKVSFAGWNGGYGRMIEIDHGNGHRTRYGHLSKIKVAEGETVTPGQTIGAVGSSGRSTGPHLHYEMVRDGRRRDPAPYLAVAKKLGDRI